VTGEVDGVTGAVREIFAGPTYVDVSLPAGRTFEQPVPRGHTALLYVFQGEVAVGGAGSGRRASILAPRLVLLRDGDAVRVHAPEGPARFLLLAAQPLHEPSARWGPFVMNTQEEIQEALRELRRGTFVKSGPPAVSRA
jgi:redox-sensitive bicupin YhaK (pirin superfamily)